MMATALEQPPTKPAGTAADSDSGVGASITPPQSANGKKEAPEGVPSELSDLELDQKSTTGAVQPSVEGADDADGNDDDDGGEIEPDHYYGGGKIPVFKPVCVDFVEAGWMASGCGWEVLTYKRPWTSFAIFKSSSTRWINTGCSLGLSK